MLEQTLAFTVEQAAHAESEAQATTKAEVEKETVRCNADLKRLQTHNRDLEWANETLLKEAERLEQRLEEMKSTDSSCELRRTTL